MFFIFFCHEEKDETLTAFGSFQEKFYLLDEKFIGESNEKKLCFYAKIGWLHNLQFPKVQRLVRCFFSQKFRGSFCLQKLKNRIQWS